MAWIQGQNWWFSIRPWFLSELTFVFNATSMRNSSGILAEFGWNKKSDPLSGNKVTALFRRPYVIFESESSLCNKKVNYGLITGKNLWVFCWKIPCLLPNLVCTLKSSLRTKAMKVLKKTRCSNLVNKVPNGLQGHQRSPRTLKVNRNHPWHMDLGWRPWYLAYLLQFLGFGRT